MSSPKNWTWNESLKTWLYGEHDGNGCGVFHEGRGWTGNACFGSEIRGIESFPDKEEAMERAIEVLEELRKELG